MRPISQLVAEGVEIEARAWRLQRWADGTLFVESPSGEGTEISRDDLAVALCKLFDDHF